MDRQKLQSIYLDQKEQFVGKYGLIQRDIDLDKYIRTEMIVVVSGVRRSGKSSLLALIRERMALGEEDFCYFNMDDERVRASVEVLSEIYQLHLELYGREPVFFLDEVQLAPGWERFVSRMYESGHKLYVTGSNATLLSSEIATTLTGRNRVIALFPFSFAEYLRYVGHSYQVQRLSAKQEALLTNDFNTYLAQGGFPLVVKERDTEIVESWFRDILYRDIVSRYKVEQVEELRAVLLFLLSNVGKPFSYATLQKMANIGSLSTVKNYLSYAEATFLLFYLKKFDYSVKKQVLNSRKVYAIDTAVSLRLGMHVSGEKGRLLENVVYIELLRRGYEVYYHKGVKECDFIAKRGLELEYAIQVCYDLNDENKGREEGGLVEAMDAFHIVHGLLIYVTDTTSSSSLVGDAAKKVKAWEWLIG